MKRLVPSLSLLACASFAAAEVISDDAAKITVGLYSQARADISHGATAGGASFSPSENAAGNSDTADFYLRRFRPYIKGSFGTNFIFQVTLAADNWNKNASPAANTTAANTLTLFDGFGGYKYVDGDYSHTAVIGKKNAWFYTGNGNSATGLFASTRPTTMVGVPNSVGIGYLFESPMIRFGFDVLDNVGTGLPVSTTVPNAVAAGAGDDNANTTNDGEGLWYSARAEFTGSGDWSSKWAESFVGKPGHGFVIGAEVGAVNHDRVTYNTAVAPVATRPGDASAMLYAIEGMFHLDALTVVADYRVQKTSRTPDTGTPLSDVNGKTWCAQAGYAIPLNWSLVPVLEPAVRYAVIDKDTDNTASAIDGSATVAPYGAADFGNSGRQFEIGFNAYFNGHKNKLAVEYIRWVGEDPAAAGSDSPNANIIRVQHQLWF